MPSEKCGVGMKNRVDITYDGYQARFHAIETSGVLEAVEGVLVKT